MFKKFLITSLLGFILGFWGGYFLYSYNPTGQLDKKTALQIFEISNLYAEALVETDELYSVRPSQVSHSDWQKEYEGVLEKWSELEQKTNQISRLSFSYTSGIIPRAYAYSAQEITAVVDAAPPMQKIKTLARFLNVDAKRAFQVLKNAQNEIEASAWNEEGDTMERLENGARAVKGVCKTGLFIGGLAIGGGATQLADIGIKTISAGISNMNLITQGVTLVAGADLVLEVGEDSASIALGYNNDVSMLISDTRAYTKPIVAISGLLTGSTETSLDAFNYVMFGADQLNSLLQEREFLGIKLAAQKGGKTQVAALKTTELKQYLVENNISDTPVAPKNTIDQSLKTIGVLSETTNVPTIQEEETTTTPNVLKDIETEEETMTPTKIPKNNTVTETSSSIEIRFGEIDMAGYGQNEPLTGNNYFNAQIRKKNNRISGNFYIEGMGNDKMAFSGSIGGYLNPNNNIGSGSADFKIRISTPEGLVSGDQICPDPENQKNLPGTCRFTLRKEGDNYYLTIKYGMQADGTNYQFTVIKN